MGCDFFVCVRNISGTVEPICSDEFECRGQRSKVKVTRDTKRHFSALSAACGRFMFGQTSLLHAVNCVTYCFWRSVSWQYHYTVPIPISDKYRINVNPSSATKHHTSIVFIVLSNVEYSRVQFNSVKFSSFHAGITVHQRCVDSAHMSGDPQKAIILQ